MSSWLEKYKADLAMAATKAKATRTKSNFDAAKLLASYKAQPVGGEYKEIGLPFGKSVTISTNTTDKFAGAAGRLLDILSRPLYAKASMADKIAEQANEAKANGANEYTANSTLPLFLMGLPFGINKDTLGAAWSGFTGKSKKTFNDVNTTWASSIQNPNRRDKLVESSFSKGLASFAEDVLMDPTTYIGPGMVKGAVSGTAKKIGLNAPKAVLNKPKFVANATDELVASGRTIVPDSLVSEIVKPSGKTIATKDVVYSLKPETAKTVEVISETTPNVPTSDVLAALTGQRDTATALLREVQGTAYAPDALTKIKAPFKEVKITRPIVKQTTEFKTVSGIPIKESAAFNAIKRLIRQAPEKYGIKSGQNTKLNDLAFEMLSNKKIPAEKIVLTGRSGIAHPIEFKSYINSIVTGKVPEELSNLKIHKNGILVPYKEYVKAKNVKYIKASKSSKQEIITGLTSDVEEISSWARMPYAGFTRNIRETFKGSGEAEKLLAASKLNKEDYDIALKEIVDSPTTHSFNTLLELQANATKIPKTELSRVLAGFGGAKNFEAAHKWLQDIQEKISKFDLVTPDEYIEAAKVNPEVLSHLPTPLTQEEAVTVSKIVNGFVKDNFFDPSNWKHRTETGAYHSTGVSGEGKAVFLSFNNPKHYDLHKRIISEVAPKANRILSDVKNSGATAKVAREARMSYMYDNYMRLLKASEDTLINKGISPILGMSSGLPLSLYDILSALPKNFVEHRLLDRFKTIPVSNILEAANTVVSDIIKGIDPIIHKNDIADILFKGTEDINTFKKALEHSAASGKKIGLLAAAADVERTVNKFIQAGHSLAQATNKNAARLGLKYGEYLGEVRKEVIDTFMADLGRNLGNPNYILEAITNIDKTISDGLRAVGNPVIPGVPEVVKNELLTNADEILPVAHVQSQAKAETAFIKNETDPGPILISDANKTLDEIIPTYTANLDDVIEYRQGVRFIRGLVPAIGNKDLRNILLRRESAAKNYAHQYAQYLSKLNSQYSSDEIVEAFKHLQDDIPIEAIGDPRIKGAYVDVKQAIDSVFSTDNQHGTMARFGINPSLVNYKFKRFGLPDKFILEGDTVVDRMQSWKTWEDIKDPLDILSKVNAAMNSAIADKLLADDIKYYFGSMAPKAGQNVRITGNSELARLMRNNGFYSNEIANQIRVLDETLRDLSNPRYTSKSWKMYDSVMTSYKAALTVYVPAHHVRNLIGDMWLSSMDGVFNPSYYAKSMKVMATRKHNYLDINPTLYSMGSAGESDVILRLKLNGKIQELTADQVYRLAVSKGVFKSYSVVEDVSMNVSDQIMETSLSKTLRKISPLKGKLHDTVTTISETREHFGRGAHFIYALEDEARKLKNVKSFDDLIRQAGDKAADRVQKWHPDASDYSRFEQEKLRKVILFYSWIRKAIPLVVEAALTQPGRFLIYPKAMYNLAESNGIDLQGLGNPFPTNQLFPSWMQDNVLGPHMGKANSYFGLNQGVPGTDVLAQYFTSPSTTLQTVMGGTVPLARVPFEVATGTTARDGVPIKDNWLKYALDMVPNGQRIDNITGDHINTGAKSNASYVPQFDLPTGHTLDNQGITVLNWLTGLGISDMSKPSYIQSARKEAQKKKK